MSTKIITGEATMTPAPNESEDAATLNSMVADSNEEHDRMLQPNARSAGAVRAAKRWRSLANLLRSARAFNYLNEEPTDEDVSKVESKSLSFISRSTEAEEPDDGVANLSLVEESTGQEEVEEDGPLKPLALKFRLQGALLSKVQPFIFKEDGSMERLIHEFADLRVKANKIPVDGIYTTDVLIDPEIELIWVRIFAHDESKSEKTLKRPVVFYCHGGGYAEFHADSGDYDRLCRKIAKTLDAVVVSANYRRSPEHRYPIPIQDCFKALQWLKKTPRGSDSLPATADVSRTILAGDSAGGNAVHHVGCQAATSDLGPIKIRAWVMFQPFFGGEERKKSELTVLNPFLLSLKMADWFWKAFLPHGANRDHKAANVTGPNAPDLKGLQLPPIFIAIGSHDILKDWQVEYGKMMATVIGQENEVSKVVLKKYYYGFHGFFAFDAVLQKALMQDVKSFVQRVLATENSST